LRRYTRANTDLIQELVDRARTVRGLPLVSPGYSPQVRRDGRSHGTVRSNTPIVHVLKLAGDSSAVVVFGKFVNHSHFKLDGLSGVCDICHRWRLGPTGTCSSTGMGRCGSAVSMSPDAKSARTVRLGAARWVGAGLLDQVVIASANAGITLLGLVLLDRGRAGVMVLSLGVGYFAMYINRAFVGDVLIALGSRYDDERRDRLVRNGLATALSAGLAGCATFVIIWSVWPAQADPDLRDLIWIAPFLPAIMLHDTARCSYLAARQPEKALVIDLVWISTQVAVACVLIVAGATSSAGLLIAWGLGAVAGATVYLLRTRARPWLGSPRRWLETTRHLSGWFTVTALIGQVHVQMVNFIVAFQLSSVEVSGLRLGQTVLIQPVQNLITAVQGLLVPRHSRRAHAALQAGADGLAAAAALRRQTAQLAAAFAVLGGLFVLVVWPLAETVLARTAKFADIAPLALPTSLQAAIYLVQLPFAAALRGMHRARMLFLQYVIFSTVGLTGLLIGASTNHLVGAVWGLASGSFAGLVAMFLLYRYALRRLGVPEAEPVIGAEESVNAV
jgi:Polysaccharide biosynthesis protein